MQKTLLQQTQQALCDCPPDAVLDIEASGLRLFRQTHQTDLESMLYDPLLCLVLQGAKRVSAGTHTVDCAAGDMIVVSHTLPIVSRITQASVERPYTAVIIPLDLAQLRRFSRQSLAPYIGSGTRTALSSVEIPEDLAGAVSRLLAAAKEERKRELLCPILLQEVYAGVMLSTVGSRLQNFLQPEDVAGQIARSIDAIRTSISAPASIADLADRAGMSRSTFHTRFKAVTGQSPVQYQKDIRLLKAQDMVHHDDLPISEIAFQVGYESPAHFSRDYSRKFGAGPRQSRQDARQRFDSL